ncbi:MAG: hypothetical protein RIB98_00625 [Acidimicrobiales bacterium]
MSGAFLAVAVRPGRPVDLTGALAACEPAPGFVADPVWVPTSTGSMAVRTWRRSDGLLTTVTNRPDRLEASFGSEAFTTLLADPGRAEATADPLGYGAMYTWQGRDVAAISTRVELLAHLATALGEPLTKDLTVAASLAGGGFALPGASGYREIRGVDPQQRVAISQGRVETLANPGAISWHRGDAAPSLPDLVERAVDELRSSVGRAVDGVGTEVVVDLTAGNDSHLILATLLDLGRAHDLQFQTIGGLGLHDARVASARAAQLGLRHRLGFPYPTTTADLADRFRTNARITCGLNNAKDGLRATPERVPEVRISGLYGELLRGWRTGRSRTRRAVDDPAAVAAAFGAGRLLLLNQDGQWQADTDLRTELTLAGTPEISVWHGVHRHYARGRLRSRATRVDDYTDAARRYPLYTKALVEVGLDAMWHHPDAPLGDLVLEALAPTLRDAPPPAPTGSTPAAPAASTDSFMKRGLTTQSDERSSVFADIAATDSDAWELIDRAAFRAAVADYPSLGAAQLSLLHGAATAVLWHSTPD